MDITSTLIQEIVLQCQKKGFVVSPQLAAYLTKTLVLPEEQEDGALELSPKMIETLVDSCVERLSQADSPSLESFKMQAAVLSQQQTNVNQTRTDSVQHRAKSHGLLQEICAKADHNKVFGDIVLYILHETGLFNTKNEIVHKETTTALESVIPRQSIESFISQSETEKMKQLDELWKIVWGIRLFNRETRKGGAGIEDVPMQLANLVQQSQSTLHQNKEATVRQCESYHVVLSHMSAQLDPMLRKRLNEEYCNRQQFLMFIEKLSGLVGQVNTQLSHVRPLYDTLVNGVRDMVTNSSSVAKSLIYPRFIEISEKWDAFTKLHKETTGLKKLLDLLLQFQSSYATTLKATMVEEAMKIKTAQNKADVNQALLDAEVNKGAVTHGCSYYAMLPSNAVLQHNGFCLPSLLHYSLLQRGRAEVGFVKYSNNFYSFYDETSLKGFVDAPQRFLDSIVKAHIVSANALVHLLALEKFLPNQMYLEGTRKPHAVVEITRCDADAQTGQIDPYKDYKYEWNEWELRRLALKLADLRNKRTHSSQTDLSHFRRDNDCQTYPKKESGCQTLIDKATQPPKTVQYIRGLQGDPNGMQIVKLTFDE